MNHDPSPSQNNIDKTFYEMTAGLDTDQSDSFEDIAADLANDKDLSDAYDKFNTELGEKEIDRNHELISPAETVEHAAERVAKIETNESPAAKQQDQDRPVRAVKNGSAQSNVDLDAFQKAKAPTDRVVEIDAIPHPSADSLVAAETIDKNDPFTPGEKVSVGRSARDGKPSYIVDGWTITRRNKDGSFRVSKRGELDGKEGLLEKTVSRTALEAWQTKPEENESDTGLPPDQMDRYNRATSKSLDWVAEKMDGGKGRFEKAVNRIDGLAYDIDEEGKRAIAKKALRGIGHAATKTGNGIRAGIDKMDQQSRKGDGWLLNKLKERKATAGERREKRHAKSRFRRIGRSFLAYHRAGREAARNVNK